MSCCQWVYHRSCTEIPHLLCGTSSCASLKPACLYTCGHIVAEGNFPHTTLKHKAGCLDPRVSAEYSDVLAAHWAQEIAKLNFALAQRAALPAPALQERPPPVERNSLRGPVPERRRQTIEIENSACRAGMRNPALTTKNFPAISATMRPIAAVLEKAARDDPELLDLDELLLPPPRLASTNSGRVVLN